MNEQLNFAPCGYLVTDQNGNIIETNQTLRNMLEMEKKELMDRRIHSLFTSPSKMYYQTYFTPLMTTYKHVDEMYVVLACKNGRMPVLMNAIERDGRHEYVFVKMNTRDEYENDLILAKRNTEKVLQEAAAANAKLQQVLEEYKEKRQELELLNDQLQALATTDPLTGLKNRRFLQEKLTTSLLLAESEGTPFSVLLIDVDFFKKVNDTYGHHTGDLVLQQLSRKLEEVVDGDDLAARMGGEEFIVVLSKKSMDQAISLAEHLRINIASSKDMEIPITISVGVTTFEKGDTSIKVLSRADEALYHSKKNGRNCVSASTSTSMDAIT